MLETQSTYIEEDAGRVANITNAGLLRADRNAKTDQAVAIAACLA
jgi:hypothetical protein